MDKTVSTTGFDLIQPRQALSNWNTIDSERVLRVLVNNLEGMVFRCAIDEQWTVHFVSDGSRELTCDRPDELEYNRFTSLEQITHPDDRLRVRQSIGQAVRGNGRYRVQYRILHRNGTEKWVLERGASGTRCSCTRRKR